MWPFKRKKSDQSPVIKPPVPKEVQEFYQAERRERVGVAWLLALATLVTTVLVAFGLFFAGRWVYHTVTKKKTPTAGVVNTPDHNTSTNSSTNNSSNNQSKNSQSSSTQSNTSSNSGQSAANNSSGSSNNSSQSAGSTNSSSQTTPNNGAGKTNLTNTGPGNTIGIFVAVSFIATATHHTVTTRKLRHDR